MSQILKMDVEVKCEVTEARWSLARAQSLQWRKNHDNKPQLIVKFRESGSLTDDEGLLWTDFLSDECRSLLGRRRKYDVWVALGPHEFDVLVKRVKEHPKSVEIDSKELFIEFISLKQNSKALLNFLRNGHTWDQETRHYFKGFRSNRIHVRTAMDFWKQQLALLKFTEKGIEGFTDYIFNEPSLRFGVNKNFPYFRHIDEFCLAGVWSWAAIELLKGSKYKLCERYGCGVRFALSCQPKRFCSRRCTHHALVVRRRQEQRIQREQTDNQPRKKTRS